MFFMLVMVVAKIYMQRTTLYVPLFPSEFDFADVLPQHVLYVQVRCPLRFACEPLDVALGRRSLKGLRQGSWIRGLGGGGRG